LVEHAFVDREGMTRFVNVNLLRLQTSEQTIQGVLYLLVTSPTRLVTSPACADMANKWENVVTFTDAHVKQS